MTAVEREFVSPDSVTGCRNGVWCRTCQGLYYKPAQSWPKVAFVATHYNVDFSEHYLAQRMAARGFGFLGWNTRLRGNEPFFLLEHAFIDIGAEVDWLKREAGVDIVVLLGNAGGGSLTAAYQSQAVGVTMQATPGLVIPRALQELHTKEGLNVTIDAPGLEAAVAIENRNQVLCSRTADAKESMRAFIEKRPPVYQGRQFHWRS